MRLQIKSGSCKVVKYLQGQKIINKRADIVGGIWLSRFILLESALN